MSAKRVATVLSIILCCAGIAIGQTEWTDSPDYPVIPPPGDPGDWDDGDRNPLAVIKVDGIYHLYFNGQPVGSPEFLNYDIGHARSFDGIVWEFDLGNPVLTRGPEVWDDTSLWGAAVIHDGSQFLMWYCGLHGDFKRAGLATSDDGSVWIKYFDNPVMDVGPPGSFDETEAKPGTVIVRDGRYQMWYTGATAWAGPPQDRDWQIGYAESADGISWEKNLDNPVLGPGDPGSWESQFVYSPSVLFDGASYQMWYSGGNTSSISIGYAWSSNGVVWTRYTGNPVIGGTPGTGFDFPNVLAEDNGVFTMWYHDYNGDGFRRAISDRYDVISIFADGFEAGDTSAWFAVVP